MKLIKTKHKNTIYILLFFLGLASVYSIVVGSIFKISAINILSNIYLQFFSTFLPGLALFALVRKKQENDWLAIIFLSYALGYCLNIISYVLLMPFGLRDSLWIFSILISLLSLYILFFHPLEPISKKTVFNFEIVALFLLMVIADVLIYGGMNASPLLTGSSAYMRDIQYWVNNAVALSLNFPPETSFLSGVPLTYHYFSSLHVAFSSLVSGIDIFSLSFPLYTLTKTLLLIGGLNYLLDTFHANRLQKFFLITTILFSTGFENIALVTNFHHFHFCPFGLDIGIAFGAFFLASFTEAYKTSDKNLDWSLFGVSMVFYAVLVGVKAPLSAPLSIIPAFICLHWLFKKNYKHCFIYGIAIVTIFLLINIFCVGIMANFDQAENANSIRLYTKDQLITITRFSSSHINLFVSLAYKTFMAQPLLVLLFGIACLKFIVDVSQKKLKQNNITIKIALILSAIISINASRVINAGGTSEMYFMMAAYVPMAALSLDALPGAKQIKTSGFHKLFLAICFLMLAWQIYLLMFDAFGGYNAVRTLSKGAENIFIKHDEGFTENTYTYTIQRADVEGLVWIRDNTPRDAIIAVDRATYSANDTHTSHYFYYAMFAERQMYIEGTSLIGNLSGANDKMVAERQQLMRDLYENIDSAYDEIKAENIDYVIQTKWLTPEFEPGENYSLVHSTDSLNIFKVE